MLEREERFSHFSWKTRPREWKTDTPAVTRPAAPEPGVLRSPTSGHFGAAPQGAFPGHLFLCICGGACSSPSAPHIKGLRLPSSPRNQGPDWETSFRERFSNIELWILLHFKFCKNLIRLYDGETLKYKKMLTLWESVFLDDPTFCLVFLDRWKYDIAGFAIQDFFLSQQTKGPINIRTEKWWLESPSLFWTGKDMFLSEIGLPGS